MADIVQNIELFGSDIAYLNKLREQGHQDFVLPTAKQNDWKYTKLLNLSLQKFNMLPSRFLLENLGQDICEKCCCSNQKECNGCANNIKKDMPFDCYSFYFEDGKFVPIYPVFAERVEVITLMQAIVEGKAQKYLSQNASHYPFFALNNAYLEEGLFVCLKEGANLTKPIVLHYHTTNKAPNIYANIRNIIIMESGASADIIEYFYYDGDIKSCYLNNVVNEVHLSPQSRLNHYKLQDESYKSFHFATNLVRVEKEANYSSFCLQKGAEIGRNQTDVDLLEEGGKASVNAGYIMNGWACLDTNTNINHIHGNTDSSQQIRGVVGGEARGVFLGKISIKPNAQQTNANLLHKALLLSEEAEVDTKPELEIFADNVKCSHGATCGELDKEKLFYLCSRGVGLEDAKQILIDAFLDDVIDCIKNEQVKDWIKSA